jgi:hypothetical protein
MYFHRLSLTWASTNDCHLWRRRRRRRRSHHGNCITITLFQYVSIHAYALAVSLIFSLLTVELRIRRHLKLQLSSLCRYIFQIDLFNYIQLRIVRILTAFRTRCLYIPLNVQNSSIAEHKQGVRKAVRILRTLRCTIIK